GVVAVIVVLAGIGLIVLTQTPVGREFVRERTLAVLDGIVHGEVRIGRISGNLLSGVTLHDISIADTAGNPLVVAERAEADYSIGALLRKRIVLNSLTLTRPLIVLDKPPARDGVDSDWNFQSIFPGDTVDTPSDPAVGFGDYILLRDVRIVGGRFVVRTPWEPSGELAGAARDSAIAAALGGDSRSMIVRHPAGFQKVMEFREVNAFLPAAQLVHPTEPGRIAVSELAMEALPFRPPAAVVRDLEGTFRFGGDSLWWDDALATLAGSRIAGSGSYVFEPGDVTLELRGAPVALADLRWLYPRLPSEGSGSLDFTMRMREHAPDSDADDVQEYVARGADIRTGDATVRGDFAITLGDTAWRIHDTDLRIASFDTRLAEQLVPGLDLPTRGTVGGRAALTGNLASMRVDADLAFDPVAGARSALAARGTVGWSGGALAANDLFVRAHPVSLDLVDIFVADFPLDGVLTGTATLDGSTASRLAARVDLRHVLDGRTSGIVGNGVVRLAGRDTWVDVDARLAPLSLVTVDALIPVDAGLQGEVAGPIRATGSLQRLVVRSTLDVTGGGTITVDGWARLAGGPVAYDFGAGMRLFNVQRVVRGVPATSLTARATAAGVGSDPATMRATLALDLEASMLDSLDIDSARVRVTIADGLARVDTIDMRGEHTLIGAGGTFGLAPGRTGTLRYRVAVDSLSAFARWIPTDTGVVEPRPGAVARAVARAREDSAELAAITAVERAATGAPPPSAQVDTPLVVRRDSIAGSLYTVGRVTGGLDGFDMTGRLAAENLLYGGNAVDAARVEYAWLGARTRASRIVAAADFDSLFAAGFALDSAAVRLAYARGDGTVALLVNQDEGVQYALNADFALRTEANELRLNRMNLRFDERTWASTGPGAIRWGPRGIAVERIELRSEPAGRIYVNGLLPTEGVADLEVAVSNFDVGDLVALLQADIDLDGDVSLEARVTGTREAMTFRGAAGIVAGHYEGQRLPELHSTFGYDARRLTTRIEAMREGSTPFAVLAGSVPLDLSLGGAPGGRLPAGRLDLELRADSLPLGLIGTVTDAVANVDGRAAGRVVVRGTWDEPRLIGALTLVDGRADIVAAGITIDRMAGIVRMDRDRIVIDSLVGYSRGPIRVAGEIDVESFAEPGFDLALTARDARVLDNERGVIVASADLTLEGAFAAPVLDGTATIEEGVLYIPKSDDKDVISTRDPDLFNVADTALLSNQELLPAANPFLENLVADVRVNVSRDTWVRSPEANVEVYGDVAVRMERARNQLRLDGTISTERGTYEFLSKRFEIARGSAIFTNTTELNPLLQATGEYRVPQAGREALTIRVVIGGTLERPKLTLESDALPPIPQSELISYLAFGQESSSLLPSVTSAGGGGTEASGNLATQAAGIAAQQVGGMALGIIVDDLEGDASRSLGLDVLNITPAGVGSILDVDVRTFIENTQIEAGRYVNRDTFVGVELQPSRDLLSGEQVPGLLVDRRLGGGSILRASLEQRYLLQPPTLGSWQNQASMALGVFLIREWRF
ncbi:MAG TPA: translocation/assembly module TamB domain-containing protein, partial [Gemmatimonadaceae bacterium]